MLSQQTELYLAMSNSYKLTNHGEDDVSVNIAVAVAGVTLYNWRVFLGRRDVANDVIVHYTMTACRYAVWQRINCIDFDSHYSPKFLRIQLLLNT